MGRYGLSSMNLVTTFRHLIIGRLRWLVASGDERDAEILALRHQILVLQRQINRPRFTDTTGPILAVLSTAFARSGPSFGRLGSTRPQNGRDQRGRSSSAPKPRASSRRTSPVSTLRRSAGSM